MDAEEEGMRLSPVTNAAQKHENKVNPTVRGSRLANPQSSKGIFSGSPPLSMLQVGASWVRLLGAHGDRQTAQSLLGQARISRQDKHGESYKERNREPTRTESHDPQLAAIFVHVLTVNYSILITYTLQLKRRLADNKHRKWWWWWLALRSNWIRTGKKVGRASIFAVAIERHHCGGGCENLEQKVRLIAPDSGKEK